MGVIITNLTKTIRKSTVLTDINITFETGKLYGLRGKNGSGKTMLLRVICGLIHPTTGTVEIDGELLGKDISFPRSVGILIETPSFVGGYSGFKNLKIIASIKNNITDQQIRESISSVGLDPDSKKPYRKYSLGMKQRLGIACAIMENPDIILLDEPFNALDDKGMCLVQRLLEERKKDTIIIIACHDKEEMELLADEIYTIEYGRITN